MTQVRQAASAGIIAFFSLFVLPGAVFAACTVVWQPSAEDLARSGWFSGNVYVGGQDRVSYDAGSDAVAIHQRKGVKQQLAEHRPDIPWVKANTAKLSVDVLFPKGFAPNKMSRLAIGLRGGSGPHQRKISGGATVDVQDGWSFRINHNHTLRFFAYAYNLNRRSKFGGGKAVRDNFPIGEWLTVELTATLNTPGLADGSGAIQIKNATGRVQDAVIMRDVVWRETGEWDSFGLILTDMAKLPPSQDQSILYRNYKLEVGPGNSCS